MTLYEQRLAACRELSEKVFSTFELRRVLSDRFNTNPASVIPSDYCYNRWNRGLIQMTWKPIFIRIGPGEFRFVGPSYAYTGLVYAKARGADDEQVVGEWLDGRFTLYDAFVPAPPGAGDPCTVLPTGPGDTTEIAAPISPAQLDRLYEEYTRILDYEVGVLKCQPTETRHLIGRLGEILCARKTNGTLAARVNQPGFDVISGSGRKISVKTTAQTSGFVSISAKTLDRVDDLMVIQYKASEFHILFYNAVALAIAVARPWKDTYELDLKGAAELGMKHPAPTVPCPTTQPII